MSMRNMSQIWESGPEAALATIKQEAFYKDLSWFVQQELQRQALILKNTHKQSLSNLTRLLPSPSSLQVSADFQDVRDRRIATMESAAQVTSLQQARSFLLNAIPRAQEREAHAREHLKSILATERRMLDMVKDMPELRATSERRIAETIEKFHTTYTKPKFKMGADGPEQLPYPTTEPA